MNSPWIEENPEYPKHRQSENLLSISHLIIFIPRKKSRDYKNWYWWMFTERGCENEPSQSKRKASTESRRFWVLRGVRSWDLSLRVDCESSVAIEKERGGIASGYGEAKLSVKHSQCRCRLAVIGRLRQH